MIWMKLKKRKSQTEKKSHKTDENEKKNISRDRITERSLSKKKYSAEVWALESKMAEVKDPSR